MPKTNELSFDAHEAEQLSKRLLSKSDKNETTGCIEWKAAIMYQGYGHINWKGKVLRAHRASYAAHIGEIKKGLVVCHKCDNPKCINPEHLFLGTQADNAKDMALKKRSTIGETNPMSKLNIAKVQAIRIWGETGIKHKDIANKFGVSRRCVGKILDGTRWDNA